MHVSEQPIDWMFISISTSVLMTPAVGHTLVAVQTISLSH